MDEEKTLALTVLDRLHISNLYPRESSLEDQVTVRNISRKVELTQEEKKKIEFKRTQQGYTWNQEEEVVQVALKETELTLLKNQVTLLDKQKKITQSMVELCLKIKSA